MIGRCLQSIAKQSLLPDEVLIIDDGSTEEVPEAIIRQYNEQLKIKIYRHNQREGVSAARNSGLWKAQYEIIAYLDSDDTWAAGHLLQSVKIFREHANIGFVFGADQIIDEKNILTTEAVRAKQQRRNSWPKYGNEMEPGCFFMDQEKALDLCLRNNKATLFTSTMVIKRGRLHPFPYFDETLHLLEDKDYYIRLLSITESVFLRACQAQYYIHENNTISIYKVPLKRRLPQLYDELKAIRKKLNYAMNISQRREIREELGEQYYVVGAALIENNQINEANDYLKQSYGLKPCWAVLKHIIIQKIFSKRLLMRIYRINNE